MSMLQINKTLTLNTCDEECYTCIAYHQCYFYFCDPLQYQIVQYDFNFQKVQSFPVNHAYFSICFDEESGMFYAICKHNIETVYVLNECFEEVQYLDVCLDGSMEILSISCHEGKIYLTTKNAVYASSIKDYMAPSLCYKSDCSLLCHTKTQHHHVLLAYNSVNEMIQVLDLDFCMQLERCFENMCQCISITTDGYSFYILCKNECTFYVIECGFHIKACEVSECQSYCDIIESIALSEAALAHILNAEGEKIQKAVACCECVEQLLSINDSTQETITCITQLEQVLYNKLRKVISIKQQPCPCHTKEEN